MESAFRKEKTERGLAVRVVLFDWGGVLVDDPSPGILEYVKTRLGPGANHGFEFPEEPMKAFQKGWISEKEFWKQVTVDLLPHPGEIQPGLWREAFESIYREKPEVFAWIGRLRAVSIGTSALSNTEAPSVEMLHDKNYDCFDETIFSCDCGWVKPEPEIYQLALGKVECQPGEILFIDDRQANAEAARAAGFKAHRFTSVSELFGVAAELGLPV